MCNQGTTTKIKLAKPDYKGCNFADIDSCIAPIVQALNDAGIKTVASCCGHGKRPGNIALEDGRELIIAKDYKTGRAVDKAFPPINQITPHVMKIKTHMAQIYGAKWADDLVHYPESYLKNTASDKWGNWRIARPMPFYSFIIRLKQAWDVFRYRADALYWHIDIDK